jgi:hypothetical protein
MRTFITFWSGNVKERGHMTDIDVNGRITSKSIFEKMVSEGGTG